LWQIPSMRFVLPAVLAVLFFLLGPAWAETVVDLELVLAVDISMSMDPEEQRLQRGGYIAAFRDPDVIKGIQSGNHGRIAVTYIEWAGPNVQTVLIPWRLIDGPSSAEAFVAELSSKEYSRYHWTSISAALTFSERQFGTSDYRGVRRVIDVSGDGVNNSGPGIEPVRDRIVANGIVINGLPIVLKPTAALTLYDAPDLDAYYKHCVIGGAGSFMIPIRSYEEFVPATRRKLLLEISGIKIEPQLIRAQLVAPEEKYNCGLVQGQMRP
jgi:Protein of unknown function (DUF1194)